jgi:hypothetical protein
MPRRFMRQRRNRPVDARQDPAPALSVVNFQTQYQVCEQVERRFSAIAPSQPAHLHQDISR